MKILLDENLPVPLRHKIPGHDVSTVRFMKWLKVKNGRLLALAASHGFEALVTLDQGIEQQQNLVTLPLAIVILHARSNKLEDVEPLVPKLLEALDQLQPNTVAHVR